MAKKVKKKGSKLLTGILCFLLGFIMAFAAIAGVVCAALFLDFETWFGFVGIDNTDEEGNNVYINTDSDNGGVSNAYELITKLVSLAGDYETMTLGDLENLIPATSAIADTIVEYVVDYLDVDSETLRSDLTCTPVNELGDYVQNLVNSIQVASLIELLAPDLFGDDAAGTIITAILYGKEADYVDGTELPVYYDVYKLTSSGTYTRYLADGDGEYTVEDSGAQITDDSGGAVALSYTAASSQSVALSGYLVPDDGGELYYLYYYVSGESAYVTDGDYSYFSEPVGYPHYNADTATLTGNYYCDENGDKVVVTAVTVGDLTDSSYITDSLGSVSITDLISSDGTDVISVVLGDYTIGDLLEGNIDFDAIELSALLSTTPSNTAMVVILYDGVSAIAQDASSGEWTCTYTDDEGNVYACVINLDSDGNISSITYTDNDGKEQEVPSTTVGGISTLIDDLELVSIMDAVAPDDDLMLYIFYGVTGVKYVAENEYTGSYKDSDGVSHTVTIKTSGSGDDEVVISVTYTDDEGKTVSTATTINSVNDVISNLQDEFEIVSLMGDVEVDDALMLYLSYKVTGAYQDDDEAWHGYITDDGGNQVLVDIQTEQDPDDETVYYVTGVTYAEDAEDGSYSNGDSVSGTTINSINDVINGMQSEFEIVNLLGDVEADDAIMVYLAYKVTGVYQDANGDWHGYITDDNGDKVLVNIATDKQVLNEGETNEETVYYVTGVTYASDGSSVAGTTIDGISDVISDMQSELEIASLLGDIEVDDAIMVYLAYKVTGVYSVTDNENNVTWYGYITDDNGDKVLVNIATDKQVLNEGEANEETVYYVTGVTYAEDAEDGSYSNGDSVSGTTIDGISDVISDMQSELEIVTLLGDVEVDDAIMMYLTYKVTGVYSVTDTENNVTWHGYITDASGNKVPVDIAVDESEDGEGNTVYYVTGVTYAANEYGYTEGGSVTGTTIDGISDVISDMQDELEIVDLLSEFTTDDDIMIYLAYSITGVYSVTENGTTTWYGTYNYRDDSGEKTTYKATLEVDAQTDENTGETTYYVTGATYIDGTDTYNVPGTTLNGINDVISNLQDDMELATFIGDITTDDDIMIYIAYSVTGVYQDSDDAWYGTYHDHSSGTDNTVTVKLTTTAETDETTQETTYYVTGITNKDTGVAITGTTINGVGDVIKYLQEDMELVTFLGDITVDDDIMIYVAYSISGVYEDNGTWYGTYNYRDDSGEKTTYTATLTVSQEKEAAESTDEGAFEEDGNYYVYVYYVTGATYKNGDDTITISGTTIDGVGDVISNLQEDMTLASFLGDISTDDNILIYVAYSVTDVYYDSADEEWYGTYNERDDSGAKTTYKVTLAVDSNGYITGVTYTETVEGHHAAGDVLAGTGIDGVGDVISNLQEDMSLVSFIDDITVEDDIMIYVAYSISGVYEDNGAWYGTYNYRDDSGEKTTYKATLEVDAQTDESTGETTYYVTGATYTDGTDAYTVPGTTISGISNVISYLQEDMELSTFIGDVTTDDDILIYVTYSVTGVYQDSDDAWYGTYNYRNDSGEKQTVKVKLTTTAETDETTQETTYYVTGITNASTGETISGTTISGVGDVIKYLQEDMELATFMGDIDVSDSIMVYVAYQVTGVVKVSDGSYTGKYTDPNGDEVTVNITAATKTDENGDTIVDDDGNEIYYITSVTYASAGTGYSAGDSISGTTIDGVGDVISGMQSELEIASLLGDISTDDDILIYVAYQVTGIYQDSDTWYGTYHDHSEATEVTYKVTLTVDTSGNVTGVAYAEAKNGHTVGESIKGTTISGIGDAIQNLQDDMEISAFLGEIEVEDNAILIYLAYSVSGVKATDNEGVYTGAYTDENGDESTVTINATKNDDGVYVISSVTLEDGTPITGTTISGISGQIDGVMNKLTIGELIDVSDNLFLNHLSGTTISGLSEAVENMAIQEVFSDSIYTDTVYYEVVETTVTDADSQVVFDSSYTYYTRSGEAGSYKYDKLGTYDSWSDLQDALTNKSETTAYAAIETAREIYTVTEEDAFDSDYLYYYYVDGVLTLVNTTDDDSSNDGKFSTYSDLNTFSSNNSSCDIYTYGEASGSWKFMLYSDNGEMPYSINHIDELMSNVSTNIDQASISDLTAAGILSISSSTLSTEIDQNIHKVDGKTYIGDLTISELIDYLTAALSYIESLSQYFQGE